MTASAAADRPLHVVYVTDEYPPNRQGGIGVTYQLVARGLVERGHAVTVVQPGGRDEVLFDRGVEIRMFAKPRWRQAADWTIRLRWRAALGAVHRIRPADIVESADWRGPLLLTDSGLPRRIPRVVRIEGGTAMIDRMLQRRSARLALLKERWGFERAGHIIGLNQFSYRTTIEVLPSLANVPYSIIPNPVDCERFHPRLNTAVDPDRVVFLGKLQTLKGIQELLLAWPLVLRACPRARLDLIGGDSRDAVTGRMWSERIGELAGPHAQGSIVWHGLLPHSSVPDAMARGAVCVFPSHTETQCIAACEALALAKPVVFMRHGPGPEVVDDGVTGLLVDTRDPADIARAIVRLLRDAGLRERMGQAARRAAEARFDLRVIAGQNEALYRRLAAAPTS